MSGPRRRRVLASLGALGTTSLAGCQSMLNGFRAARLTPSDGDRYDWFGHAVAVDGSRALIGAPRGQDPATESAGSVYVFERSLTGWAEAATLSQNETGGDDWFGTAVALAGDTALIGASHDADPNGVASGSASVYEKVEGQWLRMDKLVPEDGGKYQSFGTTVALTEQRALIGAFQDSGPDEASVGSAYVFTRTTQGWNQEAKLVADDGDSGDQFGRAVALDGHTALVGAFEDEDPNGAKAGSAYVFERDGGTWTQTTKLTPDDGKRSDRFGDAVALDADRALVGAPRDTNSNGYAAGAAYVFDRTGDGWTQRATLQAPDGGKRHHFGDVIALTGTRALVGAPSAGNDGEDAGSAYAFTVQGNDWRHAKTISHETHDSGDELGTAVALSDHTAVVGAPKEEDPNGLESGVAYVRRL